MPNWCFTEVRVTGLCEEIERLYSMMSRLERMGRALVDNGFGTNWYGNLVYALGGDCNEIHCRGRWMDLCRVGPVVKWADMVAWGPVIDVFELIEKAMPSLKVYFSAEEEGNDVFVTNDADGRFFKARYFLTTDWESEYYDDIEALLKAASAQAQRYFSDIDQLWNYIYGTDDWSLHEFIII